MVIYLGADHRGFELKEKLKAFLGAKGYEAADMGAASPDPVDDYPDFAEKVGKAVALDTESRGILICGSGAGMDITANKFRGVRATVAISTDHVFDVRHDDDVNVLVFAANFTTADDAQKMADVFLKTPFDPAERHVRRLRKIAQIENAG